MKNLTCQLFAAADVDICANDNEGNNKVNDVTKTRT